MKEFLSYAALTYLRRLREGKVHGGDGIREKTSKIIKKIVNVSKAKIEETGEEMFLPKVRRK